MKTLLPNFRSMKKFIPIVAIAALIVACNSNPKTAEAPVVQSQQESTISAEDSLVLSQFRAWKSQNELTDAREFLNGGTQNNANANQSTSSTKTSTTKRKSSGSSSPVYNGTSNNTGTAQKKGISKAAKGAVIGGVAGAAGGAIINKRNRVVGGVVGGILGAGVGYGIGRAGDKKDGRY
jgi:hypothetical protein